MRSVDQILKSAWQEVKDTHGIGLEDLSFSVIKTVDGGCFLAKVNISGGTYHVFKNKQDLDTAK